MDEIDIFVVVCTVVLFSSWGYLIWSNWKGRGYAVRFPPYGYDPCPIGYYLNKMSSGDKCVRKDQTKKTIDYYTQDITPLPHSASDGSNICDIYNKYQNPMDKEDQHAKYIYDGIPSISSHKGHNTLETNVLLSGCCNGIGKCDYARFNQYTRGAKYELKDPEEEKTI